MGMILSIISIILMVVTIGIILNTYFDKKKNKISFKEAMDLTELPIITFYNDNIKLNFLLDSGSNLSHINASVVQELKDIKTEKTEISVVGFSGKANFQEFCTIKINNKNNEYEEKFLIADLEDSFNAIKQESGVTIHGILGNQFFEKYKYVLDFASLIAYTK